MLDWLPGDEQLRRLLTRPADAKLYIHFRRHFKPVAWEQIKPLIAGTDSHLATVALFFATSNETARGAGSDPDVRSLLASDNPSLLTLALQVMWIAGSVDDVRTVAGGLWHSRQDVASYWENHWGSLLLAERSELPYDELRSRVTFPYLGSATERQGAPAEDAARVRRRHSSSMEHCWCRRDERRCAPNRVGCSSRHAPRRAYPARVGTFLFLAKRDVQGPRRVLGRSGRAEPGPTPTRWTD